MSDTVKLIVEIPKEDFEWIQTHRSVTDYQITQMLYKRVMNGTLLDDVKAKIEDLDRYYDNDYFSTNNCPMYKCNEVLQILDNIGKSEGDTN